MIARLLILILLAFPAFAQGEGRSKPQPELPTTPELLDQATDHFGRAVSLNETDPERARRLFEQAMIRYEAIVEQHDIQNTQLLLNLGNASMLAGDTGRAVLAYRRAQRLSPADARVQRSLAQARARVGVELDPTVAARAKALLLAWRGVVPRSAMAGLAIAAYLVLWTLAICRLLGVAPWTRAMLIPAATVGAVCLGLLLYEQRTIASSTDAVVSREAEALNGPSEGVYEPTFDHDLPAGVEVTLLERRDGWVRIRLIDGRETWVRSSAIAPV